MPKSNIYVLAKRFDRENPDKELEERILEIRNLARTMATVVCWENFETKTLLLTRKRFKELCRSLVYRSLHLHERAVNIVLTRKGRNYST